MTGEKSFAPAKVKVNMNPQGQGHQHEPQTLAVQMNYETVAPYLTQSEYDIDWVRL